MHLDYVLLVLASEMSNTETFRLYGTHSPPHTVQRRSTKLQLHCSYKINSSLQVEKEESSVIDSFMDSLSSFSYGVVDVGG